MDSGVTGAARYDLPPPLHTWLTCLWVTDTVYASLDQNGSELLGASCGSLIHAHAPLNPTEHTGSIWTQADEPAGGGSHVQWKGPLKVLVTSRPSNLKLLHFPIRRESSDTSSFSFILGNHNNSQFSFLCIYIICIVVQLYFLCKCIYNTVVLLRKCVNVPWNDIYPTAVLSF